MSPKSNNTLALFDFDGTLCKIDSFTGFYHYLYGKSFFAFKCAKIIPNITKYYCGLYPASEMRATLSYTLLKNQKILSVSIQAQQYAKHLFDHQLNQDVLNLLLWHQKQGHEVCLVSAGLDIYLNSIAEQLNVNLICTQVQKTQDLYTGKYMSLDCSGHEKVSRIKAHYDLEQYSNVYAYGNTQEDFAMFAIAHHVRWISKDHKLFSIK